MRGFGCFFVIVVEGEQILTQYSYMCLSHLTYTIDKRGGEDWKHIYARNFKAENQRVSIFGGILCVFYKRLNKNYDFSRYSW